MNTRATFLMALVVVASAATARTGLAQWIDPGGIPRATGEAFDQAWSAAPPAPPNLVGVTGKNIFAITGTTTGQVWGGVTGSGVRIYAPQSSPQAAAVHVGIVSAGQRAIVAVEMVEFHSRQRFGGFAANGVTAQEYDAAQGSFGFRISKQQTDPDFGLGTLRVQVIGPEGRPSRVVVSPAGMHYEGFGAGAGRHHLYVGAKVPYGDRQTNAMGVVVMRLPAGTYGLFAWAPGFAPSQISVTVPAVGVGQYEVQIYPSDHIPHRMTLWGPFLRHSLAGPGGAAAGPDGDVGGGIPGLSGSAASAALNAAIGAREEAIQKIDEGLAKLNAMDNRPDTEQRREALRQAFLERRRSHSDAIVTLRSQFAQADPPADARVPNVVGLSQAAAEQAIRKAGFDCDVETTADRSANVPTGHVLRQLPGAGSIAKARSTVRITVAEFSCGFLHTRIQLGERGIQEMEALRRHFVKQGRYEDAASLDADIEARKAKLAADQASQGAARARGHCDVPECTICQLRRTCAACRSASRICPDCEARLRERKN